VLALLIAGIWGLAARVAVVMQDDLEKVLAEQMTSTVRYVASDLDSKFQMRIDTLNEIAASIPASHLSSPAKLQQTSGATDYLQGPVPHRRHRRNKDGIIVADYPRVKARAGGNISDRSYFREPMANGRSTIGAPTPEQVPEAAFRRRGRPSSRRFRHRQRHPHRAQLLVDRNLFGQLEQTKLGSSGHFIVMSPKDNLIVSATDPKRIMTAMPPRA